MAIQTRESIGSCCLSLLASQTRIFKVVEHGALWFGERCTSAPSSHLWHARLGDRHMEPTTKDEVPLMSESPRRTACQSPNCTEVKEARRTSSTHPQGNVGRERCRISALTCYQRRTEHLLYRRLEPRPAASNGPSGARGKFVGRRTRGVNSGCACGFFDADCMRFPAGMAGRTWEVPR